MIMQITAPYFVAGIVLEDRVVVEAAPIVKYMKGWHGIRALAYCKRKRWTVVEVTE